MGKNIVERFAFRLAVGIVAACMVLSTPVLAQKIHEEVTRVPVKTLSKAEAASISSAATHVLREIAKARGAIHDKNLEQAKTALKQARTLIQIIKVSLPTVKVRDHIWVAKK
ncbi:MAG: hypothetical protein GWP07_05680, partial [Xanthomonadaceae bacterium]|nr:hypothetical protein [Xanthomonadaceae bacterium]